MALLTVEIEDSIAKNIPAHKAISFQELEGIVHESESKPFVDFWKWVPAKEVLSFIKDTRVQQGKQFTHHLLQYDPEHAHRQVQALFLRDQ